MKKVTLELTRAEQRCLRIRIQRTADAGLRTRMLIILHVSRRRPVVDIAESLHVARSTIYRVVERFEAEGWAGLADHREDNGAPGVDEMFLLVLRQVVAATPQDYGWRRPTWTQELLCVVMAKQTRRRISQPTMSRCLRAIGARLGRPRAILRCPWPQGRQQRRIRRIRRLIATLPAGEVAVYADEVDIHLNPKIGFDWMLKGQQKVVLTPGQNVKRYLAGAMDACSGRLTWVEASHKRSGLFIELLRRLERAYLTARVIHVIVDNYGIHKSRQTMLALAGLPRIRLHFLPPYSPEFNPIERVWLDLHAQVTRNHRHRAITGLMTDVHGYLRRRNHTRAADHLRTVA
jgi:transposase